MVNDDLIALDVTLRGSCPRACVVETDDGLADDEGGVVVQTVVNAAVENGYEPVWNVGTDPSGDVPSRCVMIVLRADVVGSAGAFFWPVAQYEPVSRAERESMSVVEQLRLRGLRTRSAPAATRSLLRSELQRHVVRSVGAVVAD